MKSMFFLAVGLASVAAAQTPLTLEDCRKIAAERQPALAASDAAVLGAKEAIGEARAPYYPQLDLNAGYHRWQRRAFLPAGLSLPGHPLPQIIGPLDDWNGGVASRLTVYDFGERRAAVDAAKARAAGAQADARAARADVRLNVDTAFFTLAAARELQAVAEKNIARAQAHRQLAQLRRDAGAVPEADVLRLEAELASARLQLIDAESRVRIASGQLNTAIGRAADLPIAITTDLRIAPPPSRTQLDKAVERALTERPELESSAKRADAARAAVAGAEAARAPKLHADAAFGWRDTMFLPNTEEWQAGLSVDLPLFDGGSRRHRIARSKAELEREQASFEQRKLAVRNEVWVAGSELERAWASIAANEATVRASDESMRVTQERYQRGAAVITDLLDTETALARAESSLAEARWSYAAARAAFDRAVGATTRAAE